MPKLINTFNIDANCTSLIEPGSVEELLLHYPQIREAQQSGTILIIGRGSNLLPVNDFQGTVLHSRIMKREVAEGNDEDILLTCGSGETVDDVIAWCIENKYYGMENLSLIPGEVGASAVQNIGAYGVEAKDFIVSIKALDIETGKIVTISNADCCYSYRKSNFKAEWKNRYFITEVTYRLSHTFSPKLEYGNILQSLKLKGIDSPTPSQLRQTIIDIRNEKLPDHNVEGNAGSFFMNPIVERDVFKRILQQYPSMPHYYIDADHEKIPAGWMIEQCGWKGKTLGNVGVHSRQALVLVNHGGASGQEVLELCNQVKADVMAKFGIEIHPEVNIVGG